MCHVYIFSILFFFTPVRKFLKAKKYLLSPSYDNAAVTTAKLAKLFPTLLEVYFREGEGGRKGYKYQ